MEIIEYLLLHKLETIPHTYIYIQQTMDQWQSKHKNEAIDYHSLAGNQDNDIMRKRDIITHIIFQNKEASETLNVQIRSSLPFTRYSKI